MPKWIKIFLIIFSVLIFIILLDTLQAKVFDNRLFIKITKNYNEGNILKKDIGIFLYTYVFTNGEKVTVYKWEKYSPPLETINDNKDKEDNEMEKITSINVIINNEKYQAIIENNDTVEAFIELLPQEFTMQELNGNEKYIYMDYSLPTKSSNPKYIEAGDIMLYGNNCLVIFYKSFETTYSYTKIGHIDNLTNLGYGNIIVKFTQ